MRLIRSHDVRLCGGNDLWRIRLLPLTDEHLPLLHRWNADAEVLYWSDEEPVDSYDPETVREIYQTVS